MGLTGDEFVAGVGETDFGACFPAWFDGDFEDVFFGDETACSIVLFSCDFQAFCSAGIQTNKLVSLI